jgi:hypothetical protein
LDILGAAHAEDVMSSKPTSRPKGPRYVVKNWSAYDRALRHRGDVTVWISEEAVAAWLKSDKRTAGGDPVYADLAIETVLMVRTFFHLPLRQAEGFVAAVFGLMGIDLPVPDHTTLSRRGPGLPVRLPAVPATGPVEILVDSTGLRVVEVKSGRKGRDRKTTAKRREWRKLHLGMGSGRFVASELTTWRRADAAVLPEVMDQVDGRIDRFLADGAFDGQPTYDLLISRRQGLPIPEVIVPPRRADRVRSRELDMIGQRDRHIAYVQTHGKRAWQTATGYTGRNLIEAGVSRYKRIIGRRLRTRSLAAQRAETRIGVHVLNRMLDLGRPITQRVA